MRDRYGVTIAGGQGHLKGRIARIAHCGYYGAFDIVVAFTAFEMALRDLGHDAEPGAGAGAAQRVFAAAGSPRRPSASDGLQGRPMTDGKPRVLVKEKIAESGVELLRDDFEVELGLEMSADELNERIGEFDGIVIRSQTRLTADLIARASRLKVIGRAGTGVDNVDVNAATKRGIVVVNAPESNAVAAAEHTLALALALCRNIPQAHSSLVGGDWARSRFAGNELYGKTLGVIGFGRIGQLVAHRAQAFEMEVVAFDKFVAAERFRELGVERAEASDQLYANADIVTIHLPKTLDTVNWIDAEAIAQMKDGVRIVNCARGELVDLEALEEALDSGKVAGAALDVFPEEPVTDHPLFARDNVVVTPHLGAATAEAQDRAGTITADQVRRALLTGSSPTRSTSPPSAPRRWRRWLPSCRCARSSVAWRRASATGRSTGSRPSSVAGSPSTTRGCSASPSWWGSSRATRRSRSTS